MYHVYTSHYLSTPKSQSDNKSVFSSLRQRDKCATLFLLLTMARAIFEKQQPTFQSSVTSLRHTNLFKKSCATGRPIVSRQLMSTSKTIVLQKVFFFLTTERLFQKRWVSLSSIESALRLRYPFGDHYNFDKGVLSMSLVKLHPNTAS